MRTSFAALRTLLIQMPRGRKFSTVVGVRDCYPRSVEAILSLSLGLSTITDQGHLHGLQAAVVRDPAPSASLRQRWSQRP